MGYSQKGEQKFWGRDETKTKTTDGRREGTGGGGLVEGSFHLYMTCICVMKLNETRPTLLKAESHVFSIYQFPRRISASLFPSTYLCCVNLSLLWMSKMHWKETLHIASTGILFNYWNGVCRGPHIYRDTEFIEYAMLYHLACVVNMQIFTL